MFHDPVGKLHNQQMKKADRVLREELAYEVTKEIERV